MGRHPLRHKGFTLAELLGGIIASTIFLAGTTGIVVQLMISDRKESARTETQAEMQAALNFIATDLKQAVYIYNDEFTGTNFTTFTDRTSAGDGIPDLNQILSNSTTVAAGGTDLIPKDGATAFPDVPILAFWRATNLDQNCRPSSPVPTPSPTANSSTTNATQNAYRLSGVSFELVVYYRKGNEAGDWENQGPARIQRRLYRPYQYENCNNSGADQSLNTGYVTPDPPFFTRWPYDTSTPEEIKASTGATLVASDIRTGFASADVVVAYVDNSNVAAPACPNQYSLSASGARIGFYACVRNKDTDGNSGGAQDVFVYLTGNATKRGGLVPISAAPLDCFPTGDPGFCPSLQTQVFARTYFDRIPR